MKSGSMYNNIKKQNSGEDTAKNINDDLEI